MKIYRLQLDDKYSTYDTVSGFIIAANDENDAIRLANNNCMDEGLSTV